MLGLALGRAVPHYGEGVMAPDKRPRARRPTRLPKTTVRTGPSADDVHDVVYFRRHQADDPTESEPGR